MGVKSGKTAPSYGGGISNLVLVCGAVRKTGSTPVREVALMASFKVGDNAVYPGHGVGKVTAIEAKEIFGKKHEFYTIQILENGMKIMIPKDNVESVGLRPIISRTEAGKVIEILRQTDVKIDNQTWNRRYREYMEKIKTGSVFEIAEVLRDLFLLKVEKELSFGERKMLDTARGLLLKELSLATSREELQNEEEVRAIFGLEVKA
jgi:CarD family transcriptional regulator